MSEEKELGDKLKRARMVALVLAIVTVLAVMFAIYAITQREEAEHKVELLEKIKKLELDSCGARNNDLSQYLQETLYTLEYEKKKNQTK